MLKALFAFLLVMIVCVNAKAQQSNKDSVVYYMKSSGQIVPDKDSADHIRYNMPADSIRGIYYYRVVELYLNGKPKLLGVTLDRSSSLLLTGQCTRYYQNGHIKNVINYQRGIPVGDMAEYYPNGNLYIKGRYGNEEHPYNHRSYLSECRDSTGKVLAENGEGQWLKFDDEFKDLLEKGPVSKGVEDGKWTLFAGGRSLDVVFNNGEITKTADYELTGNILTQADIPPTFKEELGSFDRFVMKNIRYPYQDIDNNVGGKVVLSFVVEMDGRLTNIKVLSAPSRTLGEAAVAVLRSSPPWRAGYIDNKPVRTSITHPFKFAVGERK